MNHSSSDDPSKPARPVWTSIVLTVAALYFAREVLIPVALALLLTFLLAPLVTRLRRWGWSKTPAVVTAVVLAFGVIAALTGLVTLQLVDLTQRLPEYRENIQAKIKA